MAAGNAIERSHKNNSPIKCFGSTSSSNGHLNKLNDNLWILKLFVKDPIAYVSDTEVSGRFHPQIGFFKIVPQH